MSRLPLARALSTASRRGSAHAGGDGDPIGTRTAVIAIVGIALFGVLVLRLWALTVLSGTSYEQKAVANQLRKIDVEAPRGQIVDRNGAVLVSNRAARQIVISLQDVPGEKRTALYKALSPVIGASVAEIRQRVKRSQVQDPVAPVVVDADETSDDVVFYLAEHRSQFPGVSVRDDYVRDYLQGTTAAQLLGQVGQVSQSELQGSFANLKPGDHVGKSGLERTYDQYLRGTDGYDAINVDASGTPQSIGRGVPATPGDTLKLSIDAHLQQATQAALRDGEAHARGSGSAHTHAGAAVALDPNTGQVLAMASDPTYNPNVFVNPNDGTLQTKLLNNPADPLINRAIAGEYPPGSTYKVVTSIAALESGFVTPSTIQECPSQYVIGSGKSAQPFRNFEGEALGAMDLSTALEASCDTWFYPLGTLFYDSAGSKLQDWSNVFGLGKLSGIDLPGEEPGVVPTPQWLKQNFTGIDGIWKPGDSVNLSIGQGKLLVTPLQMAEVYEAAAMDGTIHPPRIGLSVEDPSGHTVQTFDEPTPTKLNVPKSYWYAIRKGLELVTHGPIGTGTGVFEGFPVDIAGKTGTAEKGLYDDSWFCGYGPASAPKIVACAVIEDGGQGAYAAAPTIRDIMAAYFHVGAKK